MARSSAGRRLRGVVTDVDGTLTDASRRLDPAALALVRRLRDRGIPVTLATGNVLPIALALQRFLGTGGPIVAENGGIIFWPDDRGGTVERRADRSVALAAWRALRRSGLPARRLFTDRWRETEVALEPTVPVAEVRRRLRGHRVAVEATGYAIHLMERGTGKLPSLAVALARIGLTPADCVILGDGDNDVAMLRAAGHSVSFPSGSLRARRAARYVTRADFAAGFVEGLKESGILGSRSFRGDPAMLVGQCASCGAPASLGCVICGRTFCKGCLDADERICADCRQEQRKVRSPVEARPPPSRRLVRRAPGAQ